MNNQNDQNQEVTETSKMDICQSKFSLHSHYKWALVKHTNYYTF